jgi:WhiB family transcriptional regulator, redox-sensing transcriptional regulator
MGVLVAGEHCDWRSLAACLSADPDLFFPLSSSGKSLEQEAKAKAICGRCLVHRECLAFALRTHQAFGVWGGMSEQERQQVSGPTSSKASEVGVRPVAAAASTLDC